QRRAARLLPFRMWPGHHSDADRARIRAALDDGTGVRRLHRGRSAATRHRSRVDRCRGKQTARPGRGRYGSTYMNDVAKVIQLHDLAVEPRPRPAPREWSTPVPTVTSLTERLAAAAPAAPQSLAELMRGALGKQISKTAEFARRRLTGDYQVDEFGFDEHLLESVILPALRPLSDFWFRVQVSGMENVPQVGGALIVSNHAGTVPLDGLMLQLAIHDHHPKQRALRLLAADLVFEMPMVGSLARKAGHTLACRPDAERLLRSGEITGVFPEGFKGVGK